MNIIFKTNKEINNLFKIKKIQKEKKESELLIENTEEIINLLNELKQPLTFLQDVINEQIPTVITIAVIIFPDKNVKEAILALYEKLKNIKAGKETKKILKIKEDVRIDKEMKISPSLLFKIAYIKSVIF